MSRVGIDRRDAYALYSMAMSFLVDSGLTRSTSWPIHVVIRKLVLGERVAGRIAAPMRLDL
jgi:hypothetical protein